jgi:hypothetical protein
MTYSGKPILRSLIATVLMSAVPLAVWALDPSCRVVGEAFKKSYGLPYHQFVTRIEDGKPDHSEIIYDGKSIYMQIRSQWIAAGEMENPFQDVMKDNGQDKPNICSKLREELWNAQPAAVYQIKRGENGKIVNDQVWISPSGLVLHMLGGDADHFELRMEYSAIKAPANAKRVGE